MKTTKKGFSLIELMIVVSIIAFLATLSIPSYFKYLAKAKQAEVALNLSSLHTAQHAYYAENGKYTSNLAELNWQPAGHKNHTCYYTYGFNTGDAHEGTHYFKGKTGVEALKLGTTPVSNNQFVASAVADLNGSGKLDHWTMDESRNLVHVTNGAE